MTFYNVRNFGALGDGITDDTNAIQAALDAAKEAGGGQIYVPNGTYIIIGDGTASHGALRIYSNTEFYGDGIGQTEFKLQDGYSDKITGLIRTPVNEVTENIVIRDMTFNGNRENVTGDVDGIMIGVLPGDSRADNNILIENVEIHSVTRIAFNPHEQTTNLTIKDCVAHHNSWDGFVGDFVSNAVYENNIAYANDRHGFNIVTHSHDVVLKGNIAYDNGEIGIVVQRGSGSTDIDGWEDMLNHTILLENNEIYGNDRGILLKQSENIQVIENSIYDNDREAIYLEGTRESVLDGNIISGHEKSIEIKEYTGSKPGPDDSYDNLIINNVIENTQKALVESNSSTCDNIYAGNNIGDAEIDLNSSAIFLDSSSGFSYDLISVTSTIPIFSDISDTPDIPVMENLNLRGTQSEDNLEGYDGDDLLKGLDGDDVLIGGSGDDILWGNDGNDAITGGLGADWIKGGNGIDTYHYHSIEEGGDTIVDFRSAYGEKIDISDIFYQIPEFKKETAFEDGFLRLYQNEDNVELYLDIDGTSGSLSEEILFLTLQNNSIDQVNQEHFILPDKFLSNVPLSVSGTDSNNFLEGGHNDDTLKGRGGDDILYGHNGDDYLEGNNGNDILYGGKGADILKGSDGIDCFVFDDILDSGDTIIDFRSGEKIDIAALVEEFSNAEGLNATELEDTGYLNFQHNQVEQSTELYVDTDGNNGSTQAVLLVTIETNIDQPITINDLIICI